MGKKPRQIYSSDKDASSALLNLTSNGSRSRSFWAVLAGPFAVVPPPWPLQLPARPPGLWKTGILHSVAAPAPLDATSSDPDVSPPSWASHAMWKPWQQVSLVFLGWNAASTSQSTLWHFNSPEINSFRNLKSSCSFMPNVPPTLIFQLLSRSSLLTQWALQLLSSWISCSCS